MCQEINEILRRINKPYQYIGQELNTYHKCFEKAKASMLLAFPDKYEVGVSNLGQRVLYTVINDNEDLIADRIYAPDIDYMNEIQKANIKLKSLDKQKNMTDFDFIGFSLQYELAYPTVLKMLELGGIEPLREKRAENTPLIIAGGPCCYNPKPMIDFIDAFIVGDGEDVITEIMEKYTELKAQNFTKNAILEEFAKIDGIYVSKLNNKVKKRICNLNYKQTPKNQMLPYSQSVHDRAILEIRRGCGRMCRFCQPGHVNLPIRERKAEEVIKLAKELTTNTGYDEYSLLSLSSNDYTNIIPVIEELNSCFEKEKISVSLPSQRIDRYSTHLADIVHKVRKSTITLAPEAGSQRLRDVINKNISKEQIEETVLNCYKTGYSKIKLYFITGLPTETQEDLDEMLELLSTILYKSRKIKKDLNIMQPLSITCTLSIFVPKPFTPFQWNAQQDIEELAVKLKNLKEKASQIKNLKINYHDRYISQIEAVITRGDKNLCKYIYELYKKGVYLATWDENFDKELWDKTAQNLKIDLSKSAQKEFSTSEQLPWDMIDTGIDKQWLIQEYNKALQNQTTIPCEFNCVKCGVCKNFKTKPIKDKPYTAKITTNEVDKKQETSYKYRIKLTKTGHLKYISHLDWQNTVLRLLNKAKLDLKFSQGFNPIPKISLGIALPIFVESECEFIDFDSYTKFDTHKLLKHLQNIFKEISNVKSVELIDNKEPALDIKIQWAEFKITNLNKSISNSDDLLYIKNVLSSDKEFFITKKTKKGVDKQIKVKDSIKSVELVNDELIMILKTGQNPDIPAIRPDELIKAIINKEAEIKKTRVFDKDLNEL